MSDKISKVSAVLFSVYAAYCFFTGCFTYYISADFKLFSFSLWVEYFYGISTAAFAVCLMLYTFKGIKANLFKKALPIWLFINAVLSTGLSVYPAEGGIYSFFSYAVRFIIRCFLIFLVFWTLLNYDRSEKILRLSAIAVMLGFGEVLMLFIENCYELPLSSFSYVSAEIIFFYIIFFTLFLSACILRKSEKKALSYTAKIILLLYSLYTVITTIMQKAVYFFNTPKFVLYGMGFFDVVHSDMLFDAALLSGIGCIIIFILTIKSFKVKK